MSNAYLWIACSLVVFLFGASANMEAAYGLAITITELVTTFLLTYYLFQIGLSHRLILLFLFVYLIIEGSFLVANLHKFNDGGWFTFLVASMFFVIMYGWYFGRKLKNRYVTFTNLDKYIELFKDRSGVFIIHKSDSRTYKYVIFYANPVPNINTTFYCNIVSNNHIIFYKTMCIYITVISENCVRQYYCILPDYSAISDFF